MEPSYLAKIELNKILFPEMFRPVESLFMSRYGLALESCGTEGIVCLSLCSSPCHPYFCRVIRNSRPAALRCRQDHLKWLHHAKETGHVYVGRCHAGLALACIPAVYQGKTVGGIFFGKCLLEKPGKSFTQAFQKRFKGFRFDESEVIRSIQHLKIVDAEYLTRAGEFLQSQLQSILVPARIELLCRKDSERQARRDLKRSRLCVVLSDDIASSRLSLALEYMNYHYDQPVKLSDVAHAVKISVFRLAHLFREQAGMTPIEYLTRVRLSHARRLLRTTSWKCMRIGQSVGYRHESYFIRIFKLAVGLTPQQWRMQNRKMQSGVGMQGQSVIRKKTSR